MKAILVDYGVINLTSIKTSLTDSGFEVEVAKSPIQLSNLQSECYVLPGIGHFDQGVLSLKKSGWYNLFKNIDLTQTKFLGICLGFQILGNSSAEGNEIGIGAINKNIYPISEINPSVKPVNSKWSSVESVGRNQRLLMENKYYFTHSFSYQYDSVVDNDIYDEILAIPNSNIVAALKSENIIGIQFHPEKSHLNGRNLLTKINNCWTT